MMDSFDILITKLNVALKSDGTILHVAKDFSGSDPIYFAEFNSYALLKYSSVKNTPPPVSSEFADYVTAFFKKHGGIKIAFINPYSFRCIDERYAKSE